MRIVLDCNVVIAAAISRGTCFAVVRKVLLHHQCVLSPEILEEYTRVKEQPKFTAYRGRLDALIRALRESGHAVPSSDCPFTLPDPFDEPYLAAALSAQADLLVTGNNKHFPDRDYGNVRICSPREFMEMDLLLE